MSCSVPTIEELQRQIRLQKALESMSYLDIQIMWTLIEALWRAQILVSRHFYDLEETLKWETHLRAEKEYESYFPWDEPYLDEYEQALKQMCHSKKRSKRKVK